MTAQFLNLKPAGNRLQEIDYQKDIICILCSQETEANQQLPGRIRISV